MGQAAALVNKSQSSNPNLDKDLTAYTPGETLTILNNPKIRAYHDKVSRFRVPDNFDTIVLVPCAKSKPWGSACKSDFYKAYHQLMADPEMGKIYMATVSEPLGIVPSSDWENFPQYDNPGLFDDTAM
jgi:predicted RNA-binding protein